MTDYTELKRLAEAVRGILKGVEEPQMVVATTVVLALIAENEALRKDADRYRWLREQCYYSHVQVMQVDGSMPYVYGDELDRSVDFAMPNGAKHD